MSIGNSRSSLIFEIDPTADNDFPPVPIISIANVLSAGTYLGLGTYDTYPSTLKNLLLFACGMLWEGAFNLGTPPLKKTLVLYRPCMRQH